jgi:hypothetical protein
MFNTKNVLALPLTKALIFKILSVTLIAKAVSDSAA